MTTPAKARTRSATPSKITRGGDAGERIAVALRDAILSGEYPPGARIRQEALAQRFGASRVPVREALRTLENEGLVTLVANSGAWVSTLSLAQCEEIYQIRERIEPLLLRYAAPGLTPGRLDALEELAEAMSETTEIDEFLRLDRQFHLSSYEPAQTDQLGELALKLWNATQPYRRAYTQAIDDNAWQIVHHEHRLIVASLRNNDVAEAENTLAAHIRRTRRRLARTPELFAAFHPASQP